jgi:ureidoacrylate peracid hydrolase
MSSSPSTGEADGSERTTRLRHKVRPSATALVVVDVQNDFCSPGGVMDTEGANLTPVTAMLPDLRRLLAAARAAGVFVVHVRNAYSTPDNRYLSQSFLDVATRRLAGRALISVPMCVPGSWGADHAPGVGPEGDEPVVEKHRYSGFHQTDLELLLRSRHIRTVIPCGVATNVCVESTARDAFMRDFHVVFPADASATYYQAAHEATLSTIGMHFGEITSVEELEMLWRAVPCHTSLGELPTAATLHA